MTLVDVSLVVPFENTFKTPGLERNFRKAIALRMFYW